MLQVSNGDKKLQKKKKRISHLRKQFNSMCLYSLYKQPKDHQKERFSKNYVCGSFNMDGVTENVAPFVKFIKITNVVTCLS